MSLFIYTLRKRSDCGSSKLLANMTVTGVVNIFMVTAISTNQRCRCYSLGFGVIQYLFVTLPIITCFSSFKVDIISAGACTVPSLHNLVVSKSNLDVYDIIASGTSMMSSIVCKCVHSLFVLHQCGPQKYPSSHLNNCKIGNKIVPGDVESFLEDAKA